MAQTIDLNRQPITNEERKILKLGWLIQDIKSNGVKNPIQLIKSGQKYFCHPGTDRVLVTSYIYPIEIEGFYLWYRDLDPHPFILDYKHRPINNFIEFLNLFVKNKTFKFYITTLNENLDTSDKDSKQSNAVFDTAKRCFLKTRSKFNYYFITYFDKVQWSETASMSLGDVIYFINESECVYGNVKFLKKNNQWIPNND